MTKYKYVNNTKEIDYFATAMSMRDEINEYNEFVGNEKRHDIELDTGKYTEEQQKHMYDIIIDEYNLHSNEEYENAANSNWTK